MKRKLTFTIPSPACECDQGACPYLGHAHDTDGGGGCWAGDDEDTVVGCPPRCVDEGERAHPRYMRHVACPFGTREIVVTVKA